jgi:hypothetical protein
MNTMALAFGPIITDRLPAADGNMMDLLAKCFQDRADQMTILQVHIQLSAEGTSPREVHLPSLISWHCTHDSSQCYDSVR